MSLVYLDFETSSPVDLRKQGLGRYVEDVNALCLCFAVGDGPVSVCTFDGSTPGVEERFAKLCACDSHAFIAHNAMFEISVLRAMIGVDCPVLTQWICTSALAAQLGLPRSLGLLAEVLGVDCQKSESKTLKAFIKDHTFRPDAAQWAELFEYCVQDVETLRSVHMALSNRMPPGLVKIGFSSVSLEERELWVVDADCNLRGIPVDVETLRNANAMWHRYASDLRAEFATITGGLASSQIAKVTDLLLTYGIVMPDLSKGSVSKALAIPGIPDTARRILELRRELGLASVKKLETLERHTNSQRRLQHGTFYYGAHTGRWSSKGVQIHNLARGGGVNVDEVADLIRKQDVEAIETIYGPLSTVLSNCLRGMFQSPEGTTFVVGDFAQIEARVLAWLSGQSDVLEMFREGRDVYKEMAAKIYGLGSADAVNKEQRFIGKVAVLGLGYGMGAEKFGETLINFGAPPQTDSFCQRVVDTYRSSNSKIVEYWGSVQSAFTQVTFACEEAQRKLVVVAAAGEAGPAIRMEASPNQSLWMILPSGRPIVYQGVKYDRKEGLSYRKAFGKQWIVNGTYGGKLTENVVQGVARDILGSLLYVWSNREGRVHLVGHVHDEIIIECPNEAAEQVAEALRFTGTVLKRDTQAWASGLPVDVETYISRRYTK